MNFAEDVLRARQRIEPYVQWTPLEASPALSAEIRGTVWLKLESRQRTGSFKLRGAMSKLLSLPDEERDAGVVAASTGNHGLAVACGASDLGCPSYVFAPAGASRAKLDAIRRHGAEVRIEGGDCVESELAARRFSDETGRTYVSPYNDPDVIAGQGTIGYELDRDLERLDAVVLSVGGGGLASGVGGYLRAVRPGIRVIGCSPSRSAVMHASLEAGRIVELPSEPTLSEATAGGVEPGAITFDLCRDAIDDFVLVDEEEIADAMRWAVRAHNAVVEGAAGVAIAGLRRVAPSLAGAHVAVVVCGSNVDPAVLERVLG